MTAIERPICTVCAENALTAEIELITTICNKCLEDVGPYFESLGESDFDERLYRSREMEDY